MIAGKFDRRIELRRRVLARNAESSQEVPSWPKAYATVWAQKQDVRGREFFAAQQTNSEITTTFRIRHRTDVLMTDRIVYQDMAFNIHSIAEIGRREGLEIMATAVRT